MYIHFIYPNNVTCIAANTAETTNMKTEYFVYAGDMLLGSTTSYEEAREWEQQHDRMKVSGPFAHIKTVHTPEKGDYMEGTQ